MRFTDSIKITNRQIVERMDDYLRSFRSYKDIVFSYFYRAWMRIYTRPFTGHEVDALRSIVDWAEEDGGGLGFCKVQ